MPFQVGMREALLDWGLTVKAVPGWAARGTPNGGSWLNPVALVEHHDVIPPWSYPPNILINGRPGLPGPLCQLALERDGTWWLVAAGHANHAGPGSWRGVSGNSRALGVEANNLGNGQQVWPTVQIASYIQGSAALCDYMGVNANMVCYHREWSTGGKIDPWGPWGSGSPAPRHWTTSGNRWRQLVAAARPAPDSIPDLTALLGEDSMLVWGQYLKDGQARNLNWAMTPAQPEGKAVSAATALAWKGAVVGTPKNRVSVVDTYRLRGL